MTPLLAPELAHEAAATGGAAEWLRPLRAWPEVALALLDQEPAIARVVVAQARGSVPRDAGVCMLIGTRALRGTIGGGQLEWQAIAVARELIGRGCEQVTLKHFTLATDLGQCCGGVTDLWVECYTRDSRAVLRQAELAARAGATLWRSTLDGIRVQHEVVREAAPDSAAAQLLHGKRRDAMPQLCVEPDGRITLIERLDEQLPALWVFGAGHVGQALVRIAAELPLQLTWIDARRGLLPPALSGEAIVRYAPEPTLTLGDALPGSYFVVLTHSHALDYQLCRAILKRADAAWVGVIGSRSKAARFRQRLLREGVEPEAVAKLVCPLGISGIDSKWPAAIAVSIAMQLLMAMNAAPTSLAAEPASTEASRSECARAGCSSCQADPAERA